MDAENAKKIVNKFSELLQKIKKYVMINLCLIY